jgi:hypothetical protein
MLKYSEQKWNLLLEIRFTLEVKEVVFAANKKYWDIIKEDICLLVNTYYNNSLDLSKLNLATIMLIPKIADSASIKYFRPINFINCSCKIIFNF